MKKIFLVLAALFFMAGTANAKPKKQKPITAEKVKKKSPKKSSWSFFWNAFKFHDTEQPKIEFEFGTLAYSTEQDYFKFTRIEPFIKIKFAILEKYLQPHIVFAVDSSNINYELSNFRSVSLMANLTSSGNPSFGGGLRFFLIGWKWLNLYGYMQMQMTSLNDVIIENIALNISGTDFDIMESIVDHIDINYNIRRYDCGWIISYQPFSWWTISATAGYIWFNANIKINIDAELASTIGFLTKTDPYWIIPKRLTINARSAFGILGFKFKVYKRLHLAFEGTIVPSERPLYFGQMSLLVEGNK